VFRLSAPGGNTAVTLELVSISFCIIGVYTRFAFGTKEGSFSLEHEYNLGEATFRTLSIINTTLYKVRGQAVT
jgi:hypothetical protein